MKNAESTAAAARGGAGSGLSTWDRHEQRTGEIEWCPPSDVPRRMRFRTAPRPPERNTVKPFRQNASNYTASNRQTTPRPIVKPHRYYEAVTESDVSRVDGVSRDPERVRKLMRSYARLQGSQAKISAFRADMAAHDSSDKGAATLGKLDAKIDTDRQKPPAFKMVLTAVGDFAYRRPEDGVIVCPISALRD